MRFAPVAVLLVTLGCTVTGPEVRPDDVRDALEVSPGLQPEEVQRAIDAAKPQLRKCMRLDLPDLDDGTLDDRVLLELELGAVEGSASSLNVTVRRARSIYLDDRCLAEWAQVIELPPLRYVNRAEVLWRSRWHSTAQERRDERARIARDLRAFCDAFQTHFTHALEVGFAGEPSPVLDAAQSVLAQSAVSPMARDTLQAMTMIPPADHAAVFNALAKDAGAPECPNLADYFTRIPPQPSQAK